MEREIRRIRRFSVHFDETDMLGVAHNAVYYRWFERGRMELIGEFLQARTPADTEMAAPVVHSECDYKTPARYGDELVLVTRMPFHEPYLGRIHFLHEISNARTKQLVATGETVVTLVYWASGKLAREIPEPILERLRTMASGPGRGDHR